jgi:hypothetical protein
MAKEFEGYARECVLLARLADSVELRDQPIQLLRMMEREIVGQTWPWHRLFHSPR